MHEISKPNSKQASEQDSKLRWQCRRGVKELDLVLSQYLEKYYTSASEDEKHTFNELLALEDPILLALVMGDIDASNKGQLVVLEKLRNQNSE